MDSCWGGINRLESSVVSIVTLIIPRQTQSPKPIRLGPNPNHLTLTHPPLSLSVSRLFNIPFPPCLSLSSPKSTSPFKSTTEPKAVTISVRLFQFYENGDLSPFSFTSLSYFSRILRNTWRFRGLLLSQGRLHSHLLLLAKASRFFLSCFWTLFRSFAFSRYLAFSEFYASFYG